MSISPLIVFRIVFGFMMLFGAARFAANGWIEELYIQPEYLFPYFGFEWLPRPNAIFTYALFILNGLSAIGIMVGLFYRWSAAVFFLSFAYIELLDKTNYLNHYYFVTLLAAVLIFLPANKYFSLDVWRNKSTERIATPAWTIRLLQLMVGGLYFMAGVAKLNSDWLVEALPLKIWLPQHSHLPIIGGLMDELWVAYAFSWFGAVYDLTIPFFLLYKKTRPYAFVAVVVFHLMTYLLFPIGMFPFIMIACALIFFPAEFYAKFLKIQPKYTNFQPHETVTFSPKLKFILIPVVSIILFLLFLFPFRYLCYPNKLFWTEQGYRFSWRVMLMEKAGTAFFYVKDPNQKGEIEIRNSDYLTPNQEKMMATQPDMIVQYAHLLDREYRKKGIENPKVRAEVWVSLNGRGSRLFIDPSIDLSELEDRFDHKEWIIPWKEF